MPEHSIVIERLLENAQDGLLVIDRNRRVVYFNEACERITGYRSADVMAAEYRCLDTLECSDPQGRSLGGALCPAKALFAGTSDHARQRMRVRRGDGTSTWIETNYTVVRDRAGAVECVLGVMRDVAEAKAHEAELLHELSVVRERAARLAVEVKSRYGFEGLVSKSPAMAAVFERVRAAMSNASAVLISGESGTGKEVIARTIHSHGVQQEGPFVPLNCSALPRDLIESELFGHVKGAFTGAVQDHGGLLKAADGGTLFLDEVGSMPIETQSKLLRALQDKRVRPVGGTAESPVRVRVVAAINQPPKDAISAGRLREDLYYRLNVIGIELPPLRERREDIPLLVHAFVEELNRGGLRQVRDVEPDVWPVLAAHPWPGNVRELSNAVESAYALGQGPALRLMDFPPEVRSPRRLVVGAEAAAALRLDPILADAERSAILRALEVAGGQRNKAARLMGISRSRLYRRMEALGMDPGERR